MTRLLVAANALLKREMPCTVAATGLTFQRLAEKYENVPVETALHSCRGGAWGEEATEETGFPILRSTNMRGTRVSIREPAWCTVPVDLADACTLETGDILVTKSSGSSDLVGKAALFTDPGDGIKYLFSNFVLRLRPKIQICLPEYMAWFLRSPQSLTWRFDAQQNAVGLRNLQTKPFLAQMMPLPNLVIQSAVVEYLDGVENGTDAGGRGNLPPVLNEPRRIVARIEELAAKIEEAKGLKAFTRRETDRFWKVLSRIARDTKHRKKTLAEMAEFLDGRRIPLSAVERAGRKGKYPYYGASGIIDYIDDFIFDEKLVLLSEDGANLVNRSTPIAFVADGQYWVNNHAHVLRPLKGVADIDYLKYALADYDVSIFNFASAQAKLNQRYASSISFPLPPIKEQREIVTYLDDLQAKVDALKQLQAETAAELVALLPSVLDRAFSGRL